MEEFANREIPVNLDRSRAPILETQVSKSKDGKWLIHRTVITDIKPVKYFEKVLASPSGDKRYGEAQR